MDTLPKSFPKGYNTYPTYPKNPYTPSDPRYEEWWHNWYEAENIPWFASEEEETIATGEWPPLT